MICFAYLNQSIRRRYRRNLAKVKKELLVMSIYATCHLFAAYGQLSLVLGSFPSWAGPRSMKPAYSMRTRGNQFELRRVLPMTLLRSLTIIAYLPNPVRLQPGTLLQRSALPSQPYIRPLFVNVLCYRQLSRQWDTSTRQLQ